jgi:hypothetical protein
MPATAYFAARRSELLVVEKRAQPVYEGGRQVDTIPGVYHRFEDHRCKIEGQKSIDFMRARADASDGPEIWEISAYDAMPVVELLSEIAVASPERVEEILRVERDGPNRPEIIDTAEAVLERHQPQT